MNSFLENNNLVTKSQNGFRSKRSRVLTIFSYMSDLLNTYNKKEKTLAIYIDFKKAFDTVNHKMLVNKFSSFNFNAESCQLLGSYLSNRNQSTHVNRYTSNE